MRLLPRRDRALEAASSSPVVSSGRRRPSWPGPRIRSGTPLEVAELAWVGAGVSREQALSIPSVLACRNLIAGAIVQMHLYRFRGSERLDADYLTTKPDPSTTLPATLGGTVDDLIFAGRAYWLVLERDSEGFPRRARWTPVADVTPRTRSTGGSYEELLGYTVAGVADELAPSDVLRFDSSLPGLLDVGGPALRAALELEQAARRLAAVELPAGVLKNEGQEVSPDEGAAIADDFQARRLTNPIAFVQGMSYSRENVSPADLQLIEARANVATDVARMFNVPVSMIGASPSGNASALLYSNVGQNLTTLVTTAVAPYLRTIEATLSDAYPRGTGAAFDVPAFLRSDPQAAADYVTGLVAAELLSVEEGRSMLGIESSPAPSGDLTPGGI